MISFRRFVTTVAGCAVVVALLPACSSTATGERAKVGRNVDEHNDFGADKTIARSAHRGYVELPTGRLRIGVDTPPSLQVDDPGDSSRTTSLLPPRNGSFVRVSWDLDFVAGEVGAGEYRGEYTKSERPRAFDTINLVAGGTRYYLGSGAGTSRASTTWSVAGRLEDVRIEVSYDGVVQTLDPFTGKRKVGRAAPLYDAPAARRGDCGVPRVAAPFAAVAPKAGVEPTFACEYRVRRLGYLTGAGWAPAGKTWLVVDLDLVHQDELVLSRAAAQRRYSVRFDDDLTAVVDGVTGKAARGAFQDSRTGHALSFAVPRGAALPAELVVHQALSVVAVEDLDKHGRVSQDVDLTWTVPLR